MSFGEAQQGFLGTRPDYSHISISDLGHLCDAFSENLRTFLSLIFPFHNKIGLGEND